tara:strand:- start:22950 stop:24542 length:1593 start_codon:yes stop_codon:yes gene_type:complete
MSYFVHGFQKAFVGTKGTQADVPGTSTGTDQGFIKVAGVHTGDLKNAGIPNTLGVGSYGFFNKDTYLSVTNTSTEVTTGQSLVLAGASLFKNDKIGQFHGGYAESNKSKYINPKLVSKFYKMEDAVPQQSVVHVGVTNFQSGTTLSFTSPCGSGYTDGSYVGVATVASAAGVGMTVDIVVVGGEIISMVENQVGTGYVPGESITPDAVTLGWVAGVECTTTRIASVGVQTCEFEFLCGETYNLFINLSGSPVLRVLNHDSYRTLAAYTGCCPEGTISPVAVDSTLVMINWANQIIESPYLKDFIRPVVYTEEGDALFATGDEALAAGYSATDVWSTYVSPGHIAGAVAGLRLEGAYVDTEFGDCTFQCSDFYNKEIVQMDISLVDTQGDPCTFNGLCIETECCGFGGQGFGETYLRELIMSESYLQNFFSTDLRIREITQGTDILTAFPKNAFYTKYVIQHNVPRNYNPSGIYDNDQYNLVIYIPSNSTAFDLETFMETWLTAAGNPLGADITTNGVETYAHSECRIADL